MSTSLHIYCLFFGEQRSQVRVLFARHPHLASDHIAGIVFIIFELVDPRLCMLEVALLYDTRALAHGKAPLYANFKLQPWRCLLPCVPRLSSSAQIIVFLLLNIEYWRNLTWTRSQPLPMYLFFVLCALFSHAVSIPSDDDFCTS